MGLRPLYCFRRHNLVNGYTLLLSIPLQSLPQNVSCIHPGLGNLAVNPSSEVCVFASNDRRQNPHSISVRIAMSLVEIVLSSYYNIQIRQSTYQHVRLLYLLCCQIRSTSSASLKYLLI